MSRSIKIKTELKHADFILKCDLAFDCQGITGIFGPSGSGKTSLLRFIAGLSPQQKPQNAPAGKLHFGDSIWQQGKQAMPTQQREVGYVFQSASLFNHLSVVKNLAYAESRSQHPLNKQYKAQIIQQLNIQHLLKRDIETLSGGEKQRVCIARSLLNQPELLLLDEPLSALDHGHKQEIINCLLQLKAQLKIPMFFVSHSLNEIAQLCDQVIHIDQQECKLHPNAMSFINQQTQTANPFTVYEAMIKQDEDQLFTLNCETFKLKAPIERLPKNDDENPTSHRVQIDAKDVSLSLTAASDSSILNIFETEIIEIKPAQAGQCLVLLKANPSQQVASGKTSPRSDLIAQITEHSCKRLDLKKGMKVFAQIKAVSIH